MSIELQQKIDEHYMNVESNGGDGDGEGNEKRQRRKRFKGREVRLKSLGDKATDPSQFMDMDDEDADEIIERLLSLEEAHKFLLPASRENVFDDLLDGLPGTKSQSRFRKTTSQNHNNITGFGQYDSSIMTQETILEQSSLLSNAGSIAGRMRLQARLSSDGFCGERRRGPDIDPLYPLEARSEGRFFLKKTLRSAFGPATETVKAAMMAPNISGGRSRSKASIIQEVESKMIMADGGWLFQIAAQGNQWGSPQKQGGPQYRTTACKFNRKKKRQKRRKIKQKMEMKRIQEEHDKIIYRRLSVLPSGDDAAAAAAAVAAVAGK